jgi:hypothetical protein
MKLKKTFLSLALLFGFFANAAEAKIRILETQEIQTRIQKEYRKIQSFRSTEDWLKKSSHLSRFERAFLQRQNLNKLKMPELQLRFSKQETTVIAEGIEIEFSRIGASMIRVNGKIVDIPARSSLFQIAKIIDAAAEKKQSSFPVILRSLALTHFFYPSSAVAGEIDDQCIGDWEFMHRSPYSVLDSKLGYLGKLLLSGIVMGFVQPVRKVFTNCENQVRELKALLEAQKIGLKAIDCGSEDSGRDRSLEFWIPERNAQGAFKTKTFHLDYAQWLAQEKTEESENKKKKKEEPIYVFGMSALQEVRMEQADAEKNQYQCTSIKPGNPRFAELRDGVEPYRKIFEYLGSRNSCESCRREISLHVRTPAAPAYFPAAPANPATPASTAAQSAEEEEEDDEEEEETPSSTAK